MSGETWYMFFKPFVRTDIPGRSTEAISWNIASIYPKSDIFGEYNHLVLHVMYIVLVGLLIFYVMCRMVIRKQLQPLAYLTVSAERIAEGHYDERIPDMKRDDEVGVFVQHFQTMQKALEADIRQQQQLSATLQERHEEALLKWGVLRLSMLEVPLILNTICYYLFLNTSFGYMAIILLLCLPFVFPSRERCNSEAFLTDNKEP
jgi:hypothetical protein